MRLNKTDKDKTINKALKSLFQSRHDTLIEKIKEESSYLFDKFKYTKKEKDWIYTCPDKFSNIVGMTSRVIISGIQFYDPWERSGVRTLPKREAIHPIKHTGYRVGGSLPMACEKKYINLGLDDKLELLEKDRKELDKLMDDWFKFEQDVFSATNKMQKALMACNTYSQVEKNYQDLFKFLPKKQTNKDKMLTVPTDEIECLFDKKKCK